MSLVVGAASQSAAVLVTDSIHVELTSGRVRSGHVKHVRCGQRAAAIAGVSDVDGVTFLPWLDAACSKAANFDAIGDEFLRAAGAPFVNAYQRWRKLVGTNEPAENFLSIVIVSTESGQGEVGLLTASETHGALTLSGDAYRVTERVRCVAAGAADDIVMSETEIGRVVKRHAEFTGRRSPFSTATDQLASMTGASLSAWAQSLVSSAVARQARLSRPTWWPQDTPVICRPLHTVLV